MTIKTLGAILTGTMLALACHGSIAAGAADISRDANAALKKLYATVPAAKSLGAMQTDASRSILLEALANGTTIAHHRVRRAVVEALGQYRHPEVVKTLVRYAHADPSYAIEAEASKALG